ncbi:hypothetical protein EBQ24_05215 [Allofranklinella schreckenbergeri]|uniref:PepSY domain-containing protein n=2 Tax=Allofranklinella schreckenbergeri TaxID=1076744 RepID=A0A3M6R573_9BURK|nr:hypothetical protein EBQ24_05215 [Allofranklinella schreckenbergeri]
MRNCPLVCLGLALCASMNCAAESYPVASPVASEQHSVRQAVSSGRYKPLAEILRTVERHVPGRVVEIEIETHPLYGTVYEVEVLDAQHRKREVSIHAETGRLVEIDERPVTPERLIPLPQLLEQLHKQYPGYVEDAELELSADGRSLYAIKVIQPTGQLLGVLVDASSGKVLQTYPPLGSAPRPMRPLHDLLDEVLKRYPGIVQEAELERQRHDNRWHYEIDIRQSDNTVTLHVDPYSGRVLREQRKKHK